MTSSLPRMHSNRLSYKGAVNEDGFYPIGWPPSSLAAEFLHAVRQPAVRARAARQNAADTFLCQCREETQGRLWALLT